MLAALFLHDEHNADWMFFLAWLLFWFCAIVFCLAAAIKPEKGWRILAWLQGIAWFAAGFLALGFLLTVGGFTP